MRLVIYCTCGGGMDVQSDKASVQRAADLFWLVHDGKGHAECDAETSRKGRRAAKRKGSDERH